MNLNIMINIVCNMNNSKFGMISVINLIVSFILFSKFLDID